MHTGRLFRVVSLAAVALVIGCDDDDDPVGPVTETFAATLTGDAEVPTPVTTPAQGTATFTFRNDSLTWSIAMTSITNVTAAHIHIGDASTAGGILVALTPGTSGVSNTLITGVVTRAGFTAPAPPNDALTFDDVLDLMRSDGAYVNVHTHDPTNDPTDNVDPGDFPGGEIRGQIDVVP
jgi:hypothetical protein